MAKMLEPPDLTGYKKGEVGMISMIGVDPSESNKGLTQKMLR